MKNRDGLLHVTGRSIFTGDIPEPAGTLHAHVFTSSCAHGRITRLDTQAALEMPGSAAYSPGRTSRERTRLEM